LVIDLDGVEIDAMMVMAAQRYANHFGVSLSDVIECALVLMISNPDNEPIQLQWCGRHRCTMEVNTSGTATACPAEEYGGVDGARAAHALFIPEDVFPDS
jgi:hypothetical protein